MHKGRLEAFSDGVLAIIITIMVLELKVPHGDSFDDILPLAPKFLSYVLSFIYVAIYWNNHHHMFQLVKQVRGPVLWANTHLLFWLSLIPFVTAWSGENHFASTPIALYGAVLFMCSIAYYILAQVLVHTHGKDSEIARAIRTDIKGKISTTLYAIAIPLAFYYRYVSLALYVTVAVIWFIPDTRVEKVLKE
jgi:uncharacterized membrane protein